MNYGNYTTNTLIADIKRRGQIPDAQNNFKTEDFLAFINSELKIGIAPSVLSVQEEYYVFPEEVTILPNQRSYGIPYRALGGKLRDLFYRDTTGILYEMSKISPDDKSFFQHNLSLQNYQYYYIQGNSIILVADANQILSGSLVFTYYIRPNDLVEESRVAIISSISELNGITTYTVDSIPDGMTTMTKLDLLQAKPGHKIRKIDLLASSINSTNKTISFVTTEVDSDTEVGDHIAFAGECIIPQCPTDIQPMLAQRVIARCLEALGDTQGLANANTKLQEMEIKSFNLIDNRVEGSFKKVVNNRGLLRSARIRRNRWF